MTHLFQRDAAVLATSHWTIAESRRLLAANWSDRVNGRQDALLANSRASIAESRRLLATLELSASTLHNDDAAHAEPTLVPAAPIAPDGAEVHPEANRQADRDPAALSVRIFQDDARFRWTVRGRDNRILGQGTAETEMKARVEAFCAGMTFLDWTKERLAADDIRLH